MALDGPVQQRENLVWLVKVGLVGRECAVLAVARHVRESDSVRLRLNVTRRPSDRILRLERPLPIRAHYASRPVRRSSPCSARDLRRRAAAPPRGCVRDARSCSTSPPTRPRGIYTAIERRYDLDAGVALHVIVPGRHRRDQAAGDRPASTCDSRHPRSGNRPRARPAVRRRAGDRRAAPGVGDRAAPRSALRAPSTASSWASRATRATWPSCARSSPAPAAGQLLQTSRSATTRSPTCSPGRVAGATAFWNDEGVDARAPIRVPRLPGRGLRRSPYPELVLCASASLLHNDPGSCTASWRRSSADMRPSCATPRPAARDRDARSRPLAHACRRAGLLHAELPAFLPPGGGRFGLLVPSVLRAWAHGRFTSGIVHRTPDVASMFDSAVSSGRSP